jgi:hypothetical protein
VANYFVNSAAAGTGTGLSTTNAWRGIEKPLADTLVWGSWGAGTGGISGDGDVVWLKDDHHEVWSSSGVSRVRYVGSQNASQPVIYRADLTGVHFPVAGGSRPIIEMGDSANAYFDSEGNEQNVRFEDIDFYYTGDTATGDNFWIMDAASVTFVRCNFGSASNPVTGRFSFFQGGTFTFEDCTFDGRGTTNPRVNAWLFFSVGRAILRRCTFLGCKFVATPSSNRWGVIEFEDLTLDDQSSSSGSMFFYFPGFSGYEVRGRGLTIGDNWTNPIQQNLDAAFPGSHVEIQDHDTPRAYIREEVHGTIEGTEDAGDLRAGGSDYNFILTPRSNLNDIVNGEKGLHAPPMPYPAPADVERNYSVWVKTSGWSSFPTADELFLRVEYYNTVGSAARTAVQSTEVVSSNGTWTELSVSGIEPAEDGEVILTVHLLTNDGGVGEDVIVDMLPEVE